MKSMSGPAQRTRILIVEDEAVTAADLEATVQGLGYEPVGIVNSGPKALQKARESSPDIVLMDIGLRGAMDGIAAAREIRGHCDIPVVFITGDSNEDNLLRAGAAGAYGYILKPFRTKDLNATILLALQQHRLASDLFFERTWLRTVLESLSDGLIATDVEGWIRYLNPAGEALTDWTRNEATGRPIEDVYRLTTVSDGPVESCPLRTALRTGSAVGKNRFLMHARDGRIIPIEDASSTIEAAGKVIGAVTLFVDITERIRREHELMLEREQLEEQVQLTSQELGETRAQLRALSGHLIQAQEEERRRVARELHDDLNQRAALADIELERVERLLQPQDHEARHLLGAVRQQITRLSNGLRTVSHRLHPSAVEDLGLPAAIRSLIEDYRHEGMEVSCIQRVNSPDLSLDMSTALYRIAQEALRNAFKHARGAPVRVMLEEVDGELCLSVEDAGPGFDLEQVRGRGGLGLLSMQERARLVGGRLSLLAHSGEGTRILVCVPLSGASRSSAA
jgi:PAS domain S-box-containing protein